MDAVGHVLVRGFVAKAPDVVSIKRPGKPANDFAHAPGDDIDRMVLLPSVMEGA
jgi:hypothetical protein